MGLSFARATTAPDIAAVRAIFAEYLRFVETYLGQSLSFQGTEKEFADFPQTYDTLILAKLDGAPVAACGIKPLRDDICELKRLYCRPEGRGRGAGLTLSQRAIEEARGLGYRHMYLDTDAGLTHANAIYEELGFRDIEKYYDNPMDSRFMGLKL